jgi:SagB-type dehydrogenase family enzyme
MTSDAVLWTYALAPDVEVAPGPGGAFLRTATSRIWIEASDELKVIELLAREANSEVQVHGQVRLDQVSNHNMPRYEALLFRLDRLGLLTRSVSSRGGRLASCIPLRPPPEVPLECPLEGELRLSPVAHARADGKAVSLEVPGSWAKMTIHDRNLLPLLHDLAVGRQAAQMEGSATGHSKEAILAVLALMKWCGLLDSTEQEGWSGHDLYFHARTRNGYTRAPLGKTYSEEGAAGRSGPGTIAGCKGRLSLKAPDLSQLIAKDPPYALVSERRQSLRRQGCAAITSDELSEFLFRTLHERAGRRPYPSGGACYPLRAYLAVHRCRGIAPGLYAYDTAVHELVPLREPEPRLDRLLAGAAAAANVDQPPQILLILAARYWQTRRHYGDLSYSLIMKEVGAVFQVAMMAAAAMGLATCPLGCGDSLLFSELVGVNPLNETSVGELMLGSLE